MGKAEQRSKDAAMAANLLRSPMHSARGVAAHKAHRLRQVFASLAPGLVGSSKYHRRRS